MVRVHSSLPFFRSLPLVRFSARLVFVARCVVTAFFSLGILIGLARAAICLSRSCEYSIAAPNGLTGHETLSRLPNDVPDRLHALSA